MFDLGITEDQELECRKQEEENENSKKIANCHCTIQWSQEKRILSNAHLIEGQGIGKQSILRLC